MKTKLIKLDDAWCVRLPKALLKEAGIGDEVELEVAGTHIIVRPIKRPRQDWAAAFQQMAERGDDKLIDQPLHGNRWDQMEWEW